MASNRKTTDARHSLLQTALWISSVLVLFAPAAQAGVCVYSYGSCLRSLEAVLSKLSESSAGPTEGLPYVNDASATQRWAGYVCVEQLRQCAKIGRNRIDAKPVTDTGVCSFDASLTETGTHGFAVPFSDIDSRIRAGYRDCSSSAPAPQTAGQANARPAEDRSPASVAGQIANGQFAVIVPDPTRRGTDQLAGMAPPSGNEIGNPTRAVRNSDFSPQATYTHIAK